MAPTGSEPTVGIDVEDVQRFRGSLRLTSMFTDAETRWADAQPDPAAAQAVLWCAREAAYKAMFPHLPDVKLTTLSVVPGRVHRLACSDERHARWAASVSLSLSVSESTAMAVAMLVPPDQLHHQE